MIALLMIAPASAGPLQSVDEIPPVDIVDGAVSGAVTDVVNIAVYTIRAAGCSSSYALEHHRVPMGCVDTYRAKVGALVSKWIQA